MRTREQQFTNGDKDRMQRGLKSITKFDAGSLNACLEDAWSHVERTYPAWKGSYREPYRAGENEWKIDGERFIASFPGLFLFSVFSLRLFAGHLRQPPIAFASLGLDPRWVWLNGEMQLMPERIAQARQSLLKSVLQVVGGDMSPRSYLAAALLYRTLSRVGSRDEVIIASPGDLAARVLKSKKWYYLPWSPPDRLRLFWAGWRFSKFSQDSWAPRVEVCGDSVTVKISSLSTEGKVGAFRHIYIFNCQSYCFKEYKVQTLAQNGEWRIIDT